MKRSIRYLSLATLFLPASLWAATISGMIRTGTPGNFTPVAAAKVVLIAGTTRTDSTTSDSTGAYAFANVTTGAKTIQASATGYATGTGNVNITTAAQAAILNITLTAVVSSTLSGTVVSNATGNPAIANALVVVSTGGGGGGGTVVDSIRTNASGAYTFTLNTGTYAVTVSATGFTSITRNVAVTAAGTTSNFTLNAVVTGALSGTVVSSAAGNPPVANALVVVTTGGGGGGGTVVDSMRTDAAGIYAFTVNVATYTVTVSATSYTTVTRNVTVTATGTTSNFTLTAIVNNSILNGQITSGGLGVSGAKVVLQYRATTAGAWTNRDSTTTNVTGNFQFTGLAAATGTAAYRVMVSLTGYTTATSAAITVATGATATVNVTLTSTTINIFTPGTARIRYSQAGDRLNLDLGASNAARSIRIFNLSGVLQQRIAVPAGESRAVVPAAFAPANGFLFQIK